jgi:hypothetical protein
MSYRYDPDTRRRVAEQLFSAVPAYFRSEDQGPAGRDELRQLLHVFAASLGIARQSIEELHANLFIDSSDDWVLRYLADMVGTVLAFPDADSNRRDIRETVAFRRRKGTPRMLEDLGTSLTERVVVTQEGWKLVQMTQDLDLLRPERVLPDLRPTILAETESGPLCATHHLVDIRSISRTTGIFHPRHIAHWAHPTLLFPLEEGFPFDLTDVGDPDRRFAFHPRGHFGALRARRISSSDTDIKTDRVPPMHFDQSPGLWFGREGRFSVNIAGIPAAVAFQDQQPRLASHRVASPELVDGALSIGLLDHESRQFQAAVRVQVVAVALDAGDVPDATVVDVRAQIELSTAGAANFLVVNNGAVDPARVVMLRLQPVGPGAPFFPGAVLEIAGEGAVALMAALHPDDARQGMLRGALVVRIPAALLSIDRWFFISMDGSAFEAQSTTPPAALDVAVTTLSNGDRVLPRQQLLTEGPGPAWPPTPPSADPSPLTKIPNAPDRGPRILHGGRVVVPAGVSFDDIAAGQTSSLIFALRLGVSVPEYEPFLRVTWTGPSPDNATWAAIDAAAAVTPLDDRLGGIAALRESRLDESRLLVRFECEQGDARLTPAELAWPGYDGRNTLVYLPELAATPGNPIAAWTPGAGVAGVSGAVSVADDGSTWDELISANARQSIGQYAPLAEYATARRRRVRYRRLCAWLNEVPPLQMLPGTIDGQVDVDVEHGLFALSANEAIPPYQAGPAGPPVPPSLTVMYQDGYTAHVGARPAAREPVIDERLHTPTRIVSASGRLQTSAPATWFALPRYTSIGDALDDIALAPQQTEVVQFEDSATYEGETITWPAGPDQLIIQAAERERPTVVVSTWTVPAGVSYESLEILGVSWDADADAVFAFPPFAGARLRYFSILRDGMTLRFDLTGTAEDDRVEIGHALTGGLELTGAGSLLISDTVVDAGSQPGAVAIAAADGEVYLDRATVFGLVSCRVMHASEAMFDRTVTVTDRFRGCVRYSRVTGDSVLPRIHRVVEDVTLAFVSRDRHDPSHARLAVDADRRVLAGAEDGGEMGAFHGVHLALRYEGYRRRLEESTPAGLMAGIIRLD